MRIQRLDALLAVIALLIASPCMAITTGSADAEEIRRLSVVWMQAITDKDEPALQGLLAPEYILASAGVDDDTPRAKWIANAIRMTWSGFRYEQLKIRVQGDHAMARSRLYFRVSPIPFELDAGVVDTWEKRDGRWLVTGRFLGQSDFQDRLRFILGFIAALVVLLAWRGVRRLIVRFNRGRVLQ